MSELDNLSVSEDGLVGWCAATQPNETLDEDGNLVAADARTFGVADPRAPATRRYDAPEVVALRESLRAHNGIHGLEIVDPDDLDRANRIFHRDGFVVVRDLLDAGALARWRDGCVRVLRDILSISPGDGRKYLTETQRLPHRYSFGTSSASRQLLHDPDWASMIDLPTTTPILARLFGGMDYAVGGAGGDLCLPGAVEYQHLHGDVVEGGDLTVARIQQALRMGLTLKDRDGRTLQAGQAFAVEDLDFRSQRRVAEATPPLITINFLMSDLTFENGPIRQIPGTHKTPSTPPTPAKEPEWMRRSTLVGATAGAGVFRDNRAWHGATPNLSRAVRAMPNVEYVAPWVDKSKIAKTMPHALWQTLTEHARHLARHVVEAPGVWPRGAGRMHPLANGRKAARRESQA